jgi:hypothetical protein
VSKDRRERMKAKRAHIAAGTHVPRKRRAHDSLDPTTAPHSVDRRLVERWSHRPAGDVTIASYCAETARDKNAEELGIGYAGAPIIEPPFVY